MRNSTMLSRAVLIGSLLVPSLAAAQADPGPRSFCWLAAPQASCHVIILTDFGAYAMAGSYPHVRFQEATGEFTGLYHPVEIKPRFTADWGFLVNVAPKDALGATFFASVEALGNGDRGETGLFLRYRRWIGRERSLDLAVGLPVIMGNSDARKSPYGLVKLNLDPRLGIALRPEIRRSLEYGPDLVSRYRSAFFLSAGLEFGEKPGFALGVVGSSVLFLLTMIAISHSD